MNRRSTNDIGYTHFGGDVTAQVNSSHGVRLSGGSTGGIVEAVGDDTNVTLMLRGQGTGAIVGQSTSGRGLLIGSDGSVTLGNSSASVTLSVGVAGALVGLSTSALQLIQKYRIDWTLPALSTAGAAGASADSTVAVVGLTTSSILLFGQTQAWNSTLDPGIIVTVRCSTADELKITSHNVGPSSVSGSTKSGTLLQFAF